MKRLPQLPHCYKLFPESLTIPLSDKRGYDIYSKRDSAGQTEFLNHTQQNSLFDLMFYVVCFYPIILAVCEALIMMPYRLKFKWENAKESEQSEQTKLWIFFRAWTYGTNKLNLC